MEEFKNMITDSQPRFLSVEFHARFFPRVLWGRLRPGERVGSGFTSFLPYIALAICLILVVIGVPNALTHSSTVGWIMLGLGLLGLVAIFIQSISSWWGERPSYEGFLVGFFFLFVILGLTTGIFIGTLKHSLALGLVVSAAGLFTGYLLGILAGLWFQYLGWIAALLNILAGLGIIGMIIVDLVLLLG